MVSIRRIGVLTGGGDAPGMNPAIRAVVRTAAAAGVEGVPVSAGATGVSAAMVSSPVRYPPPSSRGRRNQWIRRLSLRQGWAVAVEAAGVSL